MHKQSSDYLYSYEEAAEELMRLANAPLPSRPVRYHGTKSNATAINGTIYVIHGGQNTYKIGFTKHLLRRFRTLQAMSPVKLNIVFTFEGNTDDEAHLHELFSDNRTHGEWFLLTDDDLRYVREYAGGFYE